jgi:hypothetical protein
MRHALPAGHDCPAPRMGGQQRHRLAWGRDVVDEHQYRTAPGGVAVQQRSVQQQPLPGISGDMLARHRHRPQEPLHHRIGVQAPAGVIPEHVHEQHPATEPAPAQSCACGLHREFGFADPAHPTDRRHQHRPTTPIAIRGEEVQKFLQRTRPAGERRRRSRQPRHRRGDLCGHLHRDVLALHHQTEEQAAGDDVLRPLTHPGQPACPSSRGPVSPGGPTGSTAPVAGGTGSGVPLREPAEPAWITGPENMPPLMELCTPPC